MITLPFDAIPGTSLLFQDYCSNAAEAKKYFIGHFTDLLAYETHLQFLEKRSYFRQELSEILLRQNKSYHANDLSLERIELLRQPNTYAVITGQQTGLFTGPLYSIYKALTAIHLTEWLEDQFPSHRFIPIFWLETEDHDLEEANEAGFVTQQNEYAVFHNGEIDTEVKNLIPVGSIPLEATIEETIAAIRESLPKTDFSEEVFQQATSAYNANETYGSAFPKFFNAMFGEKGLVFVDPSDTALKQFLSPVILREIETSPVTSEEVISRSAELEEHYHAQVKPRALNLFFSHNGKRHPVEPAETDYFLRGSRKRLSREELITAAEQAPELFSPNVLLRPVFQDYLFPTAAYVAGPSEVAYFAQLGPVYDHFQIPMPIIFPRASISIIENKSMTVLEKYNLPFAAIFAKEEELLKEILVNTATGDDPVQEYQILRQNLEALLEQLREFSVTFDQNLKNPAEATIGNIGRALSTYEEKLFQLKKQHDAVTQKQIHKLLTNLSPNGKPQERMVNIITFYNKYGKDILQKIDDLCLPFPAEHRLLIL